jgi:hypothetical protein
VELRREAEHELVLENVFILKRQKPQPRYVKADSPPAPPLDVRDPLLRPPAQHNGVAVLCVAARLALVCCE